MYSTVPVVAAVFSNVLIQQRIPHHLLASRHKFEASSELWIARPILRLCSIGQRRFHQLLCLNPMCRPKKPLEAGFKDGTYLLHCKYSFCVKQPTGERKGAKELNLTALSVVECGTLSPGSQKARTKGNR